MTEEKFGVKVCRKRKCQDLQRDPKYPDSPQRCAITNGTPGSMHCCIKEMDDEHFIRQISGQLNSSPFDSQRPGIKNCPEACPYKLLVDNPNPRVKSKKMGICAFTGWTLGEFFSCPCNVQGNPRQEDQITLLQNIVTGRQKCKGDPQRGLCYMGTCPDGKDRGAPLCDDCPVLRVPLDKLTGGRGCPLWSIPAKLLPQIEESESKSDESHEESTKELKIKPEFKNLIPGLSTEEFRGLEESLQAEGCRDPIVTWNGIIVDGHNRYNICTSLKIPFKIVERQFADETEVKIWIIKNQFSRRNLLPYVRATLAESLKGMIAAKAKGNQKLSRGKGVKGKLNSANLNTREEVSNIAGVSHDTISRVEFINEKASEEVKQKLANGETSINAAYKELKNPGLFTSETDEWYTPKEIIESVLEVFGGQIDVDPCSNSSVNPNVPAVSHFTKVDNGLLRAWCGKIYMNPPYGREIKDWVLKLIEEKQMGNIEEAIALVPARTDTEWFAAFDPHPWCAVKGRLKFSDHPNSAPFPSAIFYLGSDEDLAGLERFCREFSKHGIVYQTITGGP